MTCTTVPPEPTERDPERTDRYPEVQAIVDRWIAPADDQNGGE